MCDPLSPRIDPEDPLVQGGNWMGLNGGVAMTVFVDGWMEGLWRMEEGRPTIVTMLRKLTKAEQSDLDAELDRVTDLFSR